MQLLPNTVTKQSRHMCRELTIGRVGASASSFNATRACWSGPTTAHTFHSSSSRGSGPTIMYSFRSCIILGPISTSSPSQLKKLAPVVSSAAGNSATAFWTLESCHRRSRSTSTAITVHLHQHCTHRSTGASAEGFDT